MEIVIKIDDERYKDIQRIAEVQLDRSRFQTAEQVIANGIPLDDIKDEIEEIEINGHIRDVECFSAGINAALKIIDKYRTESEE